jgi:hypothetical protein
MGRFGVCAIDCESVVYFHVRTQRIVALRYSRLFNGNRPIRVVVGKKRFPIKTFLILFGIRSGRHRRRLCFFSRGGNIPDGVLLASTVLESVADGYVEAHTNVALFSTQIRDYEVQLERGWLDLVPISSRGREKELATIMTQDAGYGRFQLPFKEWDYRLFKARFMERLPLTVGFEQQEDKLLMKVDNTGTELVDCWLLVAGQRYSLGNIPRGSHWQKKFPLVGNAGQEENSALRTDPSGLREITFKDKTRDILFHSSFFPRDGEAARRGSGAAIFLGWVKNPNRRIWVDDPRIWNYDYTLFRTIFPLAGAEIHETESVWRESLEVFSEGQGFAVYFISSSYSRRSDFLPICLPRHADVERVREP